MGTPPELTCEWNKSRCRYVYGLPPLPLRRLICFDGTWTWASRCYTEATYLSTYDAAKAWEAEPAQAQDSVGWWNYPKWINYSFDYNAFVDTYHIPARIEAWEIDEVWVFAHPYAGIFESRMIGRSAFFCNSYLIIRSDSRNFIVMGFNYERDVSEMLEDFGHRTESIMAGTYGRWTTNPYYPRYLGLWPRVSMAYSASRNREDRCYNLLRRRLYVCQSVA